MRNPRLIASGWTTTTPANPEGIEKGRHKGLSQSFGQTKQNLFWKRLNTHRQLYWTALDDDLEQA
jgi:hypothetical protein